MIEVDGSEGEGGGQVLRTALSCALLTGEAVRLVHIRARRAKPGLMRQHLTAVNAAVKLGQAEVEGAELHSKALTFRPTKRVQAGHFHFAIGTAGSTTLVLQTVLPALLAAQGKSEVLLEGGTHNPMAPPFEFIAGAFLPALARMGAKVSATLERAGFYPAGGGRLKVAVEGGERLRPLSLLERGEIRERHARALLAHLPEHIAERELAVVRAKLGCLPEACEVVRRDEALGPGNALFLELASAHVTEVFSSIGETGKRAERVAEEAVAEVRRYLVADVPVGVHLADQLVLPLAMARGGAFRTVSPSGHTKTQLALVQRFLDVKFEVRDDGRDRVVVEATPD